MLPAKIFVSNIYEALARFEFFFRRSAMKSQMAKSDYRGVRPHQGVSCYDNK